MTMCIVYTNTKNNASSLNKETATHYRIAFFELNKQKEPRGSKKYTKADCLIVF